METTPPPSEPRKRGRPKGSTKAKADKDKDPGAGGVSSRMRGSGGERRNTATDESYAHWKQLVPVLYDWLASHNLLGSSSRERNLQEQTEALPSEQTDHTQPNTLIIANCEVVKPRVAAENHIANVNRIRELPQNKNIVATHTDCPEVLIWDVEAQPNRHALLGAADSRPDLVLTGHQDNAEFALAMCPAEPFVLSGGKDKSVVLWSIQDHVSTLAADTTQSAEAASSIVKAADNSTVGPRGVFEGHSDTVEDVQFCPSSSQQFCSVGDDSCLILWDARIGNNPVVKVEKAHNADLHCVDWNSHDENYILTGSADHTVCMFDRRNLTSNGVGSPVHKFEGHKAAVLCVQWSPDKRSVFGSSAEDGLLNIWDYEKVGQKEETGSKSPGTPAGLFFQHAGHRDKVVDFHWNAYDPWTIVSVSDDGEFSGGGGTLQLWRMTDLLYRPKEEVLAELQKFKDHVIECSKTS
ncbi:UNVERIFIED_CONTAM: WD-40 repeat-containing protein MSI4 [Sesamum calycinum]|uniref:WD-40 repeat-containing protein MSI4 n=1 Tax=Sesamum calycinum TaxID=2727403 RepID=A0AAW2N0N4_9LAMI